MDDFKLLMDEMERGSQGLNCGIPTGFHRLNKFTSLRKRLYTLIFGSTGSGKSAFLHDVYILNPADWYMSKSPSNDIKLKIILFSMERSKVNTLAKWVSRKIFLDHGIRIPPDVITGTDTDRLPTKTEMDLVGKYADYVRFLTGDVIDYYEGPRTPGDIFRIIKQYSEANGKEEQISEFKKVYIPNNPNEIVIPIIDHLGILISSNGGSKKEIIDKTSGYMQYFRDFCGYSPIAVSQINREMSSFMYSKMDSFEPTLDHAKESGRPAEDADRVISLFDPLRYGTTDRNYDASKFVNPDNMSKHFRSVKILKNTYGEDDIKIGMGFWGESGIFRELPRPKDMHSFDYGEVISGNYFKVRPEDKRR